MPEAPHTAGPPARDSRGPTPGFLRLRWRGQAPLRRLFWRDLLAFGTVLNLVFSFGALMLAAQGLAMGWAVLLHFAPTPWNAFLVAAVWRTPAATRAHRAAALAWLGLMLVL